MEPTEQAEEGLRETGQPGGRKPVQEELTWPYLNDLPSPVTILPSLRTQLFLLCLY